MQIPCRKAGSLVIQDVARTPKVFETCTCNLFIKVKLLVFELKIKINDIFWGALSRFRTVMARTLRLTWGQTFAATQYKYKILLTFVPLINLMVKYGEK